MKAASPLWLLALILTTFTYMTMAEGAVRELDCISLQTCDTKGYCQTETQEVKFSMEPLAVNDDGSGSFAIHYNSYQAPMTSLSFAGPFHWTVGNERHTLLASSETHFLWHQLDTSGSPSARIQFMQCRFTQ